MYDFKETEEKVGKFWDEHAIFNKSLELRRKGKRFVFWEGPPTANGLPGVHHVLARAFKDIICRYKTMRGFFVLRKAGWDTHGLPVEIEIEKELGFMNKKQIEEYGIAKFNRKARESVWKYKKEWEELTRRMGYWLDLDNPYVTYEINFMESVWYILKELWDKGLLYQAHKVVPYCPRCGTPLSLHEVAQGYEKITERSVYLKFKVIGQENTFIIAWTTTPWTLPGNVALAVGPEIKYVYARKDGETFIISRDLASKVIDQPFTIEKEVSGNELVGLKYEPLFDVKEMQTETAYQVYPADFVSTADGTGVVHIAPMYGVDDYDLGTKFNLPKFHTVTEQGKFIDTLGDGLGGKAIIEENKKNKVTEDFILEKLKEKNVFLKAEDYEHDYPFCWRCHTPLLYYAKTSWFTKITAVNKELVANNETINWVPGYIKEGRFGQWLREARDGALSRERYWGTPLPIWTCTQCDNKTAIGSIKELEKLSLGSKNTYYVMRHGGTMRKENVQKIISSRLESDVYHLTEEGQMSVENSLELLKLEGIDAIYASPFLRTKETAEIAGRILHQNVDIDDRLVESRSPAECEDKPSTHDPLHISGSEGEESIRARVTLFMKDLELKHRNKKILIVTHGTPMYLLMAVARGYTINELKNPDIFPYYIPSLSEIRKVDWRKIPRNEFGELDLHRPFIDDVVIKCPKCKSKMRKVPDLIDVWFDSGSMPYAQWHYPFENKQVFKQQFPADYISEAIDQTRGWFYMLLAISTMLGKGAPFKNVICLNLILDKEGKKMSKSKGNAVSPVELMDKVGADAVRWYMYTINAPGDPKLFNVADVEGKLKGFFTTLENCVRFYELYAGNIAEEKLPKLSSLDKWIISKLHHLIASVTDKLDAYDITTAMREIETFVVEDLSNWWIRRSRKRKESLPLLRYILIKVARLLAPAIPFTAEGIYSRLHGELAGLGESVHLSEWPKSSKRYLNDKLEEEMEKVKKVIASGLAQRKEKQTKVRQPLQAVSLKQEKFSKDLEVLIKEELNVKKMAYNKDQETEVALDFELTPALIREGYARELMRQIQDMRKEAKYQMEESVIVDWHSEDKEIISAIAEWTEDIKKDTVLKTLEQKEKHGDYDLYKESLLAPDKKIYLGIKK